MATPPRGLPEMMLLRLSTPDCSMKYTLGKKGCYTPIEDNKTNVDRTFVFPLGWNWHDMYPWLFPNEIRLYLGQTFNARSSGIVELRNHSIGGRSPKSIFTLWQLWINICIFFQKFFWLFEQCPVQPLWVLGMRCLHLPVRALSKVLLLPVWVWLVLPSTTYSKGMLPLDLWCQASLQRLPERQHLGKTVHCWGWSDRIVSWVLGPWRRGWEICMEWGLVAQRLTTDSCPVVTGHMREVLLHVKRERVLVTSDSGAQIRYTSRSRTLLGFAPRHDVSSDKQAYRYQQMTRQQSIKHIRKQKWTYTA